MYYSRGYADHGDEREPGPKRQRMTDQGPPYYGGSPGPSLIYNTTPQYTARARQPLPFPVVRLRGLPFDCNEADIAEFFHGLDIVDVLFIHKGGRFTGEAYCLLGCPLQVEYALQRNRQNIGRRYIEVFQGRRHDYYSAIASQVSEARSGSPHGRGKSYEEAKDSEAQHTGVLRLRGLPYSATREDLVEFFRGYGVAEEKVHIVHGSGGRPTGDAFVEFAGPEQSRAAMSRDRESVGSRYVELFASSREEMERAVAKGR